MSLFLATLVVVGVAMALMAVGLFFKRPCLRGSCGGPDLFDSKGESLTCAACPRRRSGSAESTPTTPAGTPSKSA